MAGPTIVGSQVAWGTDSNTTYGMIQTLSIGTGGDVKTYKDYLGDAKTLVISDQHDTVNLTAIVVGNNTTPPTVGTDVTIKGKKFKVTSASVDWANEDGAKITISGRTYPTIGSGGR